MFSMLKTRLDVIFATSIAPGFPKNSGHQYIKAVKTILQYFKESKNLGIIYGS